MLTILSNRRALSPVFATMMLVAIVMVCGSVAFFFSNNMTKNATDEYLSNLSASEQSISERMSFQHVQYNPVSQTLTIYLLNYGTTNDIKLNSLILYDQEHKIVGGPYDLTSTALRPIDDGDVILSNSLNSGDEGYFAVTLTTSLEDELYRINLITQSGAVFVNNFIP